MYRTALRLIVGALGAALAALGLLAGCLMPLECPTRGRFSPLGPFRGEIAILAVGQHAIFAMGSPPGDIYAEANEGVGGSTAGGQRPTVLTRPFYMMPHAVTRAEWDDLMGNTPWGSGVGLPINDYPATFVSWNDAVDFANRLSIEDGLTPVYTIVSPLRVDWNRSANGWRLPTEAEWEFAARAGTTGTFAFTDPSTGSSTPPVDGTDANFDNPSANDLVPVDSFAPNAWGLYNMFGNVWEWVWDFPGPYQAADMLNPTGPPLPDPLSLFQERRRRGGAANSIEDDLRSARRSEFIQTATLIDTGFRLVRNSQ